MRFLQWKQAQESTETLMKGRASALERYRYYLRLLDVAPDSKAAPDKLPFDRRELTEENFGEAYSALVGQYEKPVAARAYAPLTLKEDGKLRLLHGEFADLNEHPQEAALFRTVAAATDVITSGLALIPDLSLKAAYWGVGTETARISGGSPLSFAGLFIGSQNRFLADIEDRRGQSALKTASYERRADEWTLNANIAARELMQFGRQILGSLIAEQAAYREYQNIQALIEQSETVDEWLRSKHTNEELYTWMQGELSRLYYEYYRFAFDTARKAEQTMKRELMRPEADATDYIKFNYWEGGRKGLLSGEALYLDVKRMELAYHEHNKRELELTKHVSLRQLNPIALLALKATGTCEFTVPEWFLDLDCPGHYMRRLKHVSVSIPSVAGPFTSVSCTLSLLKSSIRKSPLSSLSGDGEYVRQGSEDTRFVDYFGTIQSIVTSSGSNDGGTFETVLSHERFLAFEGAGAESTWKMALPGAFRQFNYDTIADVILHLRYTARDGGAVLKEGAETALTQLVSEVNGAGLSLMFSLRYDFPNEWHKFVVANAGAPQPAVPFSAKVRRDHFPYFTQGKDLIVDSIQIVSVTGNEFGTVTLKSAEFDVDLFASELNAGEASFAPALTGAVADVLVPSDAVAVFIVIRYALEAS